MPFDDPLRHLASRLPQAAPPETLKGRIMHLIASAPAVTPVRQRRSAGFLLAFISVTVMLVLGLALTDQVYFRPRLTKVETLQSAPDAIAIIDMPAKASLISLTIHQSNTWHFVGWRIVDGQTKRWEVWGRRSPAFYREQIGSETVVINNSERAFGVLPPDSYFVSRRSLLIATKSSAPQLQPHALLQSGLVSTAPLINLTPENCRKAISNQAAGPNIVLQTHTDRITPLRTDIRDVSMTTVDSATDLPVGFQLERQEFRQNKATLSFDFSPGTLISTRIVGQLRLAYNITLPKLIERSPPAPFPPATLDFLGSRYNGVVTNQVKPEPPPISLAPAWRSGKK